MILLQDIGEAVAESATDATEMATGNLFDMPWLDPHSMGEMAMRFFFTLIVTLVMVYCLYYRRSKRREYFFTYILLSLSVFFLIYLLGSVKVKIGFALGLFAIFGILRYRTDTIPVREMTYMFSVIAISVVNALATNISVAELLFPNLVVLLATWLFERFVLSHNEVTKLVLYDRVELITAERRDDLITDLRKRLGEDVTRVSVGSVDFLKDSAILKVYYRPSDGQNKDTQVSDTLKIRKDEWQEVKE